MVGDDEDITARSDNKKEKCVAVCPISPSNVNLQGMIASPEQDKNSAAEKQENTSNRGEGGRSVGSEENLRKSGTDAEAGMFTSVGADSAPRAPGVSQDSLRIPDNVKSCSQSPSKSPNYVRKPMPINEPKPGNLVSLKVVDHTSELQLANMESDKIEHKLI